jgi:uncharacterized peroxidase-related enzyme
MENAMSLRLPYDKLSPEAYKAIYLTYAKGMNGTVDKMLGELINLRVSQINQCAYCMERHARALREGGQSNARVDTVVGWYLSPHFTDPERAALAWAEAVSHASDSRVPDQAFQELKKHFSDAQISDLTFIASTMNALNRLTISMRL